MGLTKEALRRMRDAVGDDDLVIADILQSFVDEVDGLSERLTAAAAGKDVKALHLIAHTLKSCCRDLGDAATGELCARLENDAREGEVGDAAIAAAAINAGLRELRSEVLAYLSAS